MHPTHLDRLFPFHLRLDHQLRVLGSGPSLAKLLPDLREADELSDHFVVRTPQCACTLEGFCEQESTVFFVESTSRELVLKGQMVVGEDRVDFLCSPVLQSMEDVGTLGLTLGDFALHDSTVDYLILLQTRTKILEDTRSLTDRLLDETRERRKAQELLQQSNDELEEMVHKRTRQLNEALAELRKQNTVLLDNQRLQELVEHITRHDLRSPVAGIISMAELVRDQQGLTPLQEQVLDRIVGQGYDLIDMLNQSLDLHKIEQGTYTLQRSDVDLLGILKRIETDTTAMRKRGKGLHCSSRTSPADSFVVHADGGLVYSMLSNLVRNAFEACGGDDVRVTLWKEGQTAFISIHNEGAIPKDVRPRFFQKYTTSGKKRGTGLGTYSARLVAREHGGTIDFTTSQAAGTTVTVQLPGRD